MKPNAITRLLTKALKPAISAWHWLKSQNSPGDFKLIITGLAVVPAAIVFAWVGAAKGYAPVFIVHGLFLAVIICMSLLGACEKLANRLWWVAFSTTIALAVWGLSIYVAELV